MTNSDRPTWHTPQLTVLRSAHQARSGEVVDTEETTFSNPSGVA